MDNDKFGQILNENKWILFKVINTYCNDSEDRKDLEQEILIQLWKSLKSYNSQSKISTWIYRIAMNVSISYYRTNKKRKTNTDSINESIFQVVDHIDNTEALDEKRKFLYDFISQLDKFNKEIMVLYLDDCSYKEIAEIVGITVSNVGTKINRLKKKLKEYQIKLNTKSNGIR